MGATKVQLTLSILESNPRLDTVVVSDADTVWLRDPAPYLAQHPAADWFISTDCLSARTEAAWAPGHNQPRCGHVPGNIWGRAYNTGGCTGGQAVAAAAGARAAPCCPAPRASTTVPRQPCWPHLTRPSPSSDPALRRRVCGAQPRRRARHAGRLARLSAGPAAHHHGGCSLVCGRAAALFVCVFRGCGLGSAAHREHGFSGAKLQPYAARLAGHAPPSRTPSRPLHESK